jgi:hypothetical protein
MQPFFFRINRGKNDFITKAKKYETTTKVDIPGINPPKFGGGLIFELNPREIGSAFHRAGAQIGQNNHLWAGNS